MMMITVILCTYNRCESLAAALKSLAASRLPSTVDWEILVVDNNSNDGTREVVEEFCDRHASRFRYLFEPKQGKSHALNAGVQHSQSEILAFADDDAVVAADWLWNLTSSLRDGSHSGAGGRIIPTWTRPRPRWLSEDAPHTVGPFVSFDDGPEAGPLTRAPYGANMAFCREVFEKYGDFRTDLGPRPGNEIRCEDIEFAERLLNAGERLRYEPSAVVYHPVPENRVTKRFMRSWWFWSGYSEVLQFGLPPGAGWRIGTVPLYLLRRIVRWTLQWLISVRPARRFYCEMNACYVAGIIRACNKWSRDPEQGVVASTGRSRTQPAQTSDASITN
ncbi:MAG TPA: glycosyltransferase [Terracidiphilus sp.]|jgi:glycosyltransferase involved in cell wall biosynthesis